MKNKIYLYNLLVILCLFTACENKKEEQKVAKKTFNEANYVLDATYSINDARRYGLTASTSNALHPKTKKTVLETVLDIAEKSGEEILMPSGFYNSNLVIKNRQNLNLKFDNSEFGLIHIIAPDTSSNTSNIIFKGTLTAYANLGIISSSNIKIDTVFVKTDLKKNPWGKRATGAHIFRGSKDITINYLEVDDLGSGEDYYKHAHAALSIDGVISQPQDVHIKTLKIKSTDRHGVYMTGTGHVIDNLIIDQFGVGSALHMSGMPLANNKANENKEFKALWINKCNFCYIEKISVNEQSSNGTYTALLDEGDSNQLSEIVEFIVLNDNPKIEVKKEENTNVQIVSITKK